VLQALLVRPLLGEPRLRFPAPLDPPGPHRADGRERVSHGAIKGDAQRAD
jgi:hypothetical protein